MLWYFSSPKHVWNCGMLCLWIETQSQISLYDYQNHKFICYMHNIYHFERKFMKLCSLRDARIIAFWHSHETKQAIKYFGFAVIYIKYIYIFKSKERERYILYKYILVSTFELHFPTHWFIDPRWEYLYDRTLYGISKINFTYLANWLSCLETDSGILLLRAINSSVCGDIYMQGIYMKLPTVIALLSRKERW